MHHSRHAPVLRIPAEPAIEAAVVDRQSRRLPNPSSENNEQEDVGA
jgi:hypothetical protein